MNIKLDRFCLLLNEAEEERGTDDSEVSPYLLKHLLYPYLAGEDILLNDLNYDAFTLSDMDILFEYISEMETACNKVHRKADILWKSTPAARPSRAFC